MPKNVSSAGSVTRAAGLAKRQLDGCHWPTMFVGQWSAALRAVRQSAVQQFAFQAGALAAFVRRGERRARWVVGSGF